MLQHFKHDYKNHSIYSGPGTVTKITLNTRAYIQYDRTEIVVFVLCHKHCSMLYSPGSESSVVLQTGKSKIIFFFTTEHTA